MMVAMLEFYDEEILPSPAGEGGEAG